MRSAPAFAAAAATSVLAAVSIGPSQAAHKEPPSCAAVTFRPIPSGMADGEQNAGLYKSRFGRIEVMATVKGGEAQTYFVEINGKAPQGVTGELPKTLETCAKAKRLGPIGKSPESCLGDRLAVLIQHVGDRRYVLLYAHQGSQWHFCSVGTA